MSQENSAAHERAPAIFISSVTAGLAPYRALVAEIVRGNGYRTEVQDDFEIYGGSVADIISTKINACQGVICLLGSAYGRQSPVRIQDNHYLSYTQLEFFLARRTHRPMYIFIARGVAEKGEYAPEDPSLIALQKEFIDQLKVMEPRPIYYYFKDDFELLKLLATARWERWLRHEEGWH